MMKLVGDPMTRLFNRCTDLFTAIQGSKLTSWRLMEKFGSPDRKFWLPTYFMYNLHKNTILYVTLHARKVTTEE